MNTAPVSAGLIVIAGLLVACKPSPKLPITGEIKLEVVRKEAPDIHFKLKNQNAEVVSFQGVRSWWWQSVFPQVPRFECALSDPDQPHESPYPLLDGPDWKKFMIDSGEEIDIVVSDFYLKEGDAKLPAGRCRLMLQLGDGAIVKSDEFESP